MGEMMKKAILFVHGLGGDKSTWGNFDVLINQDDNLGDFEPFFYEYKTRISRFFSFLKLRKLSIFMEKYVRIQWISKGLETYISHNLKGYDEIILVGHSLGGLVIRKYLLDQNIAKRAGKIKKVIFYAVPQNGAELARWGSLIFRTNRHLSQLSPNSEFLETLNAQWTLSKIENDFIFKIVIAGQDHVVSKESVKNNFRVSEIAYIDDKDHCSVVKPENQDDLSFKILKEFALQDIPITLTSPDGSLTYKSWYDRDVRMPFFSDESREKIIQTLKTIVSPRKTIRIIGLSGLGKTRTVIEALNGLNDSEKKNILYIDATTIGTIVLHVNDWVSNGYSGILVVDNCPVAEHCKLHEAISRPESKIFLITIDSDLKISGDFIELKRLSNEMIHKMLTYKFNNELPDIERIVDFAQGFPQMAVLLANARINEEENVGTLTDDDIARKLLWGTDQHNHDDEKMLMGCALFNHFGLENEAKHELQFIADIERVNVNDLYYCIRRFAERKIIDQRGRYAQLVPKPLAIRLAAQWWGRTLPETQRRLINEMPASLVENFCEQVRMLDFLPEVKRFTSDLCGDQGPFGQTEVILSDRGSRFFRAFVDINPETTSKTLNMVLSKLSMDQLKSIAGDVRRNFVWSLERLCFHSHLFEESAWSLLLLARAENEGFSNNATGVFSQLFHIQISGTEATPQDRFSLLDKALALHDDPTDNVILNALKSAINTYSGHRTVGAEYQGTKPPLQEWQPQKWQEIFDYWQNSLKFLLVMLSRGDWQKDKVLDIIGSTIRSLVNYGQIDMLDSVIKKVVKENGSYWPAALTSIKHVFEYDSKKLDIHTQEVLSNWLSLLCPDNASLEEKLRILIINPPWEHHKNEHGHYIDKAEENARILADTISSNDLCVLNDYIATLSQGEQKQSYSFGQQLIIKSNSYDVFLNTVMAELKKLSNPNISFCLGLMSGVFIKSPDAWQCYIDNIAEDKFLSPYYPYFIKTGQIEEIHLEKLIDLVEQKLLPASNANVLGYGSVTSNLIPNTMINFSLKLSEFGNTAAWTSLNIMFMYCFMNDEKFKATQDALKILVTKVSLVKDEECMCADMYHWHELAQKLLIQGDEAFAIKITHQILKNLDTRFEYGNLEQSIKPILIDIMKRYGEKVWPIWGEAIASAHGDRLYWLDMLLARTWGISEQAPSPLSMLPPNLVISWCHENREIGPWFVASCINIFNSENNAKYPSKLFIALLENFGDDKRIRGELFANLATRGWSGSLVPHLESDKKALQSLINHSNQNVQLWLKEYIDDVDKRIAKELMHDEEAEFGIY